MRPPAVMLSLCLLAAPLAAADGALDNLFQTASAGILRWGEPADVGRVEVLEAPDGALVLVVDSTDGQGNPDRGHWRRVTQHGADPLCALAGGAVADFRPSGATFDHLGRLVVVGETGLGGSWRVVVARFLYPDCTPDPAFDGNGYAAYFQGLSPLSVGIVERRFGSGLVVLYYYYVGFTAQDGDGYAALARIDANGVLDGAYGGGDGWASARIAGRDELVAAMALDRAGRFVLVSRSEDFVDGEFLYDWSVFRFTAAGELDTGFSGDGGALIPFDLVAGGFDEPWDVAAAADGRIAIVGRAEGSTATRAAVAVLRENGAFDSAFDGNGKLAFEPLDGQAGVLRAAAFQSDGRLIVAGRTWTEPLDLGDSFVARLGLDGAFDGSFAGDGVAVVAVDAVGSADDGAQALTLAAGRPVVAGAAYRGSNLHDAFVYRLQNGLIFADGFESASTIAW